MFFKRLAVAALVGGAPALVALGSAVVGSGSALQAQQINTSDKRAKTERFDGQSIFSTVATQTPRNSRDTGGGLEESLPGAALANSPPDKTETLAKNGILHAVATAYAR